MITLINLQDACAALLAADPVITDQNDKSTRRLSTFTSGAEGWCGFVEEVVTEWLVELGFDAEAFDCGSRAVAWFGIHYLTRVALDDGVYAVDFTASQIPAAVGVEFPVIAPVDEYLSRFELS